jgi:hypothetical protein
MWPVVAIAAGTALAQWYNSEKSRAASKEDRKRIEDLIRKFQSEDAGQASISPEEYKLLGTYTPEIANYVKEKAPEVIKTTNAMREGQSAQLDALRRLRDISRQDKDPALMAQLDLAAQRAQSEAQSRQQSVLQDAQRRGQGGSLGNLVSQMQGGEAAMTRNAEQGRLAAIEAYRNKLSAMRDSATLGGQIRGQDIDLQGRNANIINSFNQRAATGANQYLQGAADTRNRGQMFNLEAAQGISDKNVGARNQFAQFNRNADNNNRMNYLNALTGNMNKALGERQQYGQDMNQVIQGVGNAGMAGYMYGQNQSNADRASSQQDRRAVYERTGFWGTPQEYEEYRKRQIQDTGYGQYNNNAGTGGNDYTSANIFKE